MIDGCPALPEAQLEAAEVKRGCVGCCGVAGVLALSPGAPGSQRLYCLGNSETFPVGQYSRIEVKQSLIWKRSRVRGGAREVGHSGPKRLTLINVSALCPILKRQLHQKT